MDIASPSPNPLPDGVVGDMSPTLTESPSQANSAIKASTDAVDSSKSPSPVINPQDSVPQTMISSQDMQAFNEEVALADQY